MKYGWITINISDMWNKPQYDSERVNQLLFSDFVKVLDEKNNFFKVEKYDRYQGWVDKRFVSLCSYKNYQQFLKQKKYVVTAKTLLVSTNSKMSINPHFLYYGTKLSGSKLQNNRFRVNLPDKTSCILSSSGVKLIPSQNISASLVIKEAKRFLGVPYLWGGISAIGFDCSGFTQTLLSRFGITIPRDTKEQISIGEEISRDKVRTGDLLFFERHVGFAIGKYKLVHSSIGEGGVRINSLTPTDKDYRKDLDESFKTARRIL